MPCALLFTLSHPYRPAHVHFMISIEGYGSVTTELFLSGDACLDSDAVFGVGESLIVPFIRDESNEDARELNVSVPFYTVDYDFVLAPV